MYLFFVGAVGLVPEESPLEHEEQHDAGENVYAAREGRFPPHNLRQDVDEHVAEECSGGKTDEIEEDALHPNLSDAKRRNADERDEAHHRDARKRVEPDVRHGCRIDMLISVVRQSPIGSSRRGTPRLYTDLRLLHPYSICQ